MILLSILIPIYPTRNSAPLLYKLQKQAEGRPVEILTCPGKGQSGHKRHHLLSIASGEYVCFVDDDDDVSLDYIDTLLEGIRSGADVVTFSLRLTTHNRTEVWNLSGRQDDRKAGLMSMNHLCVWRKDLAQLVAWCPSLGPADDMLWYRPLISYLEHTKKQLTYFHVGRVLYYYQYNPNTTLNQNPDRMLKAKKYFGRGLRCLEYNDKVVIEDGYQKDPLIRVRFPNNSEKIILPGDATPLCTVCPWFCRKNMNEVPHSFR